MIESVKALLAGIVDYAGLFPPAALDMEAAVEAYAAHRGGPHRWMLARFICPAARLDLFREHAVPRMEAGAGSWPLSLLAGGGDDLEHLLAGLGEDLEAAGALSRLHPGLAVVQTLEARFPPGVLADPSPDRLREVPARAGEVLASVSDPPERIYYELGFTGDWERVLPEAAAQLAAHNRNRPPTAAGMKIRTGGLGPEAFPSSAQVAAFLVAARDAGVPFKATAGLHHPLRHPAPGVHAVMHGFLNVFVAAALAHVRGFDAAVLVEVLEEEDPSAFHFDDLGLAWRDHRVPLDRVREARERFAAGFGSCSFDEPVEDLAELGLL